MDQNRAAAFEALHQFIDSQKAFLDRTQSDIERLRKLKAEFVEDPDEFCSNLSEQLNDSACKLSKRLESWTKPPDLDWGVYTERDPTPLKLIANDARNTRTQPHSSQRSELSELQSFVKSAKCRILDPVVDELTRAGCFDKDEGEEIDIAALKKELELERLMKLKKRKIKCGGLTISISARVPANVVVRRDLEDESAHVDISLDEDRISPPSTLPSEPVAPLLPPSNHHQQQPMKSARVRRASAKVQEQECDMVDNRPSKKSRLKMEPEDTTPPTPAVGAKTKRSRDAGKPKPETYKQAWSTSEQHLLEKLLEEIPVGEKNRWQKISQAMDGRRTPRQVASRVQKYFEKLKRFGIGVNGS